MYLTSYQFKVLALFRHELEWQIVQLFNLDLSFPARSSVPLMSKANFRSVFQFHISTFQAFNCLESLIKLKIDILWREPWNWKTDTYAKACEDTNRHKRHELETNRMTKVKQPPEIVRIEITFLFSNLFTIFCSHFLVLKKFFRLNFAHN